MPTVLRINALAVMIWPNDHRPPHVHVIGPDQEARFALNCPDGPPALMSSVGFRTATLNEIQASLIAELAKLCDAWRQYHGDH